MLAYIEDLEYLSTYNFLLSMGIFKAFPLKNASKYFFRKELRSMEDRDVSEQIALGVPAKKTGDGLFDQRLFGENKGMDSGFDRK